MSGASIVKQCCVVRGGAAGMMLGFLLARAGVSVAVLEKHADFLRDFRGASRRFGAVYAPSRLSWRIA